MNLKDVGWEEYSAFLEEIEKPSTDVVARVLSENKTNYDLLTSKGDKLGVLRGKTLYDLDQSSLPKVGDWVIFSKNSEDSLLVIESILPRKTVLSRQTSGKKQNEQIIATNIDTVFVIQGLDGDFNINRLERYLIMVEKSGAKPVIILNKTDIVDDVRERMEHVEHIAPHVPIVAMSVEKNKGVEGINKYLEPKKTSVFVGSSGVGKSTLLNCLFGKEIQETQPLRDDDKGRHTTTRRELFMLSTGAIIIDTPGMRELSLGGIGDVKDTFQDIEEIAMDCKYKKCDHVQTKECAVLAAVKNGRIEQKRVDSYLKLQREIDFEESKEDKDRSKDRKQRVKKTLKEQKKIAREKYNHRGYK
ncbi:MAG: ribosome small subunit-dependent GTPase A [Candidatus Pacebacteria bacterium]|nr:ribosome small subunit-dependent GTPase A [Candidatus Paceibacterota bacterium]